MASLFPSVAAHPAWTEVQVEDLLSHAAGLTDSFVDATWLNARRADAASAREQRSALVTRVLANPPPERRGDYRYGNLNYVLVGSAIEQATGTSWEEAMRRELFAPLGITEAGFGPPPRTGPWGRMIEAGFLKPVDPSGVADNPAILWPSGGVHITASGYARFLSAFLRNGTPLLRPETLTHLLKPSRPGLRYAGGWSLEGPTGASADMLTHNGSNTFWFATAIIDRTHGHGYAAVTNRGGERGAANTARLIRKLRVEQARS